LLRRQIGEGSNCGSRIIDNNENPFSDDKSDNNEDTPQPNDSAHDNDELTAPPRINLEEMVEQQQKMIDFLFKYNTKLLE
jgi:hypothetical protein